MKKQLLALSLLAATFSLKAQNPYPIIPIDSVQFVNASRLANQQQNTFPDWITPTFKNPTFGDTVRFEGIVAFNPRIYGLSSNRKAVYVQREGGGPWSGVLVMCEPSGTGLSLADFITETKYYENMIEGTKVRVTGVIRDFQGETQVNLIRNSDFSDNSVEQLTLTSTPVVWTEIQANQLMTGNPNIGWVQQKQTAEQYEGTPVIIRNVTVYNITTSGNRSFWSVIDDYGNVLDVRDMSAYYRRDDNEDTMPKIENTFQPPAIGTRLEYIRGYVTEYSTAADGARYGIVPMHPADVKVCTSCPPMIRYVDRTPLVSKTTDAINITAEVTSVDATISKQVLYYKKPGTSVLDSVTMTGASGSSNYIGTIPSGGNAGVLTWWVRAEDNQGRSTFFPDPLTLGRSFYVTANGVDNIRTLQFSNTNSNSTIWHGDSLLGISVQGIVTTNDALGNMITIQDGTGPNSAIFVQRSATFGTDTLKAGDLIEITRAKVSENFNVTTLYSIAYNLISRENPLPAMETTLSIDSFINNNVSYARPYEGVLMRFENLKVVNTNPDDPNDYQEFSLYDKNASTTVGLRVDDLSAGFKNVNRLAYLGMEVNFIQGPMYFANGNFKIIPRNHDDMDFSGVDTSAPVITILGNNPDSVHKGATYTDAGATALDNKDGDVTSSIVTTGTVNTDAVGTYEITYTVSDALGNEGVAKRTVIVYDSLGVGLNKNELASANISVYPNPASDVITITASDIKTLPLNVAIYDMVGRKVLARTYTENNVNETINIAGLNKGVYFFMINNAQGSRTIKFVVAGK
jgi:hypothetical protein